ncbi:MAG: PIN domain-containing protein [Actinomycetota bacterium]|nr:PIN domain-containing protein [Actinomycetota bacterium]
MLDSADAHHERAVAELGRRADEEGDLLLAASAYAEALVKPLRDGTGDVVERFVERALVEVVPISRATARRAAELRARHRVLRLGDALVLASAQAHDAELLTFDDRLRRIARESR